MTVSRVVNNKNGVSDATRKRIQEIIDRLGYRPSDIARGLATARTGTIGLVVIDNSNPFFSEVARGVEHVAYAGGYNVFLCNTEEDPERELAVLQSLEEKRVDGLILCSSRLDDDELQRTLAHHSAVVLVNRKIDDPRIDAMLLDDEKGGLIATQHLVDSGHRTIGFLAGPEKSYSGCQRAKGYQKVLKAAGLPHNPEWKRHCLPVVEAGKEAAIGLLRDHPELTALFCYNDLIAVGALQACAPLGRSVPDDLAIVGHDDIPLAALVTPPLTTCYSPKYELGSQAMRLLLAHINGCAKGRNNIVFRPELVIRGSAP